MKANREALLCVHLKGVQIADALKSLSFLEVTRRFLQRTVKRYKETGQANG